MRVDLFLFEQALFLFFFKLLLFKRVSLEVEVGLGIREEGKYNLEAKHAAYCYPQEHPILAPVRIWAQINKDVRRIWFANFLHLRYALRGTP